MKVFASKRIGFATSCVFNLRISDLHPASSHSHHICASDLHILCLRICVASEHFHISDLYILTFRFKIFIFYRPLSCLHIYNLHLANLVSLISSFRFRVNRRLVCFVVNWRSLQNLAEGFHCASSCGWFLFFMFFTPLLCSFLFVLILLTLCDLQSGW